MTSSEDIISVSALSKRFGKVEALSGLTLHAKPGIIGLIGPNGSGKTTLLRILLGLIHADGGQAEVLGLDVSTHSLEIRRRIGVLHERPIFTPTSSTLDYLQDVKQIYRSQSDPEELLALVGLEEAHDRKIGDLSAGMHQRLGIAQALIGNPELVFLDEPTSNLDVVGRDEIIKLIIDLNLDLGVSFFIASHILSELEKACHNVAFIQDGKIVEKGSVRDIIQRQTQRTLRVLCSEPKKIYELIQSSDFTTSCVISGANTVTISIREDTYSSVKERLDALAQQVGTTIYAIEQANTLEDAYKEIMKDDKS